MTKKPEPDPLRFIPSAAVVRRKLAEIQDQARRLGILLRTAEEIEQTRQTSVSTDMEEPSQGGSR